MAMLFRCGCVPWVLGLVGCASGPARVESWCPPPLDTRAIVVVIDGAGGSPDGYNSLSRVVREQALPLQVVSFEWSHGPLGFIADQVQTDYTRAAGCRLAERVRLLCQQAPGKPIELMAHSAGTLVALSCAEALPPDSLERIVLLAPAVSCTYDLRPALRCSRRGIDVYCSERDRFYLGFGIRLLGTTDGKREDAAGRIGFCNPAQAAADPALYAKLHQHPWEPSLAWTGHNGEHGGAFREAFMRTQIIPLLWPGP
jgi:pimeloyl-ACP methyl ester carboxylesterase